MTPARRCATRRFACPEGEQAGGHHQVAVAFSGPPAPALAAALDRRLSQECADHAAGRGSGSVGPVEVITVHPDAFLWEWERSARSGQRPPRIKDRVFLPDEETWTRIVATAPEVAA
ncbi:hypothetical protein [Streptomyces massasporeus]